MDTSTKTLLTGTMQSTPGDQNASRRPNQAAFIAYVIVMTVIVLVGFVGNVLTILVLRRREHKNKVITPLMINLAVADIIIIVFGYPVIAASNFTDHNVLENQSLCIWSGFINGSVGIATIACLTMMSFAMLHSFSKVGRPRRVPTKKMAGMIIFTWLYGVTAMFPPLVGWNEFVPGTSGISCCPNWLPETKSGTAYNVLLVFVGFFLPLSIIVVCYKRIYRLVKTQPPQSGNIAIQASRKRSQMKLVRMTAMAIAAFVLSWSPYCLVSIIATIRGSTVLSPGEAEVPDLLAKASVIYNPIVYTVMNDRFRITLWQIVRWRNSCSGEIDVKPARHSSSEEQQNSSSLRKGTTSKEDDK